MTGIYIHLPFCLKKCSYCDFVSYENRLSEAEPYVSALLSEMEEYRGTKADTLYLGGGTPTAVPAPVLARLIEGAAACFSFTEDAEITVEANPGTCNEETFSALVAAGVNRISLGVQSFIDHELAALGRIHRGEDAKKAVLAARNAGIRNISLDLMFSIPLQTTESLLFSIDEALCLKPEHLSCYSLTLCEGTPLFTAHEKGLLSLPDDDEDRARYRLLTRTLEKNGYERYEISNFARPGKESRHNTKYWKRAPYIGLGAAAHSFFRGERYENPAGLSAYYERVKARRHPAGESVLGKDAMAEAVFLGLRQTKRGLLREDFYKEFSLSIDAVYGPVIQKLCSLSLLEDFGAGLRLTDRGIDVSNAVFCEFL